MGLPCFTFPSTPSEGKEYRAPNSNYIPGEAFPLISFLPWLFCIWVIRGTSCSVSLFNKDYLVAPKYGLINETTHQTEFNVMLKFKFKSFYKELILLLRKTNSSRF